VWYPCSFIVLAIRENYSIIKDKKCFARFEFILIINSLLRLSFLAITSCIYVLWGHHDYLKKGKLICSNSRKLILSSWMGWCFHFTSWHDHTWICLAVMLNTSFILGVRLFYSCDLKLFFKKLFFYFKLIFFLFSNLFYKIKALIWIMFSYLSFMNYKVFK
jgi:hypothetical protein